MQNDAAIRVHNVSKSFKLPHEKQSSIKGTFINALKGNKRSFETQRVLQDVSFEINKGEFFGIVGRNGSGKSTLLKMLANIYSPTKGKIEVNGKLTPFIELGVGFNPELTGRENVYLNGALLGFNRQEVTEMYDDIVAFAEIERFMDQKLKNYSSGMQVRLAFSIAIQAKSDILLLDEVLAVGDEAFQKKCIAVFEQYKANKQTIILVTHDMSVVEKFCSRALMIDSGKLVEIGDPSKIARLYSQSNENSYLEAKEHAERVRKENGVSIELLNEKGQKTSKFAHGDTAVLKIKWQNSAIKNIGCALLKQSGEYVFGTNTIVDYVTVKGHSVSYRVKLRLGAGDYLFKIGVFGTEEKDAIDFLDGPSFLLSQPKEAGWQGLTELERSWE